MRELSILGIQDLGARLDKHITSSASQSREYFSKEVSSVVRKVRTSERAGTVVEY